MTPRREGRVTAFPSDKSFGFISPFDGDGDVFFHLSASRYGRPKSGDFVIFDEGDFDHGSRRVRAENVDLIRRRSLR
jgi:cold shock CspA family protein